MPPPPPTLYGGQVSFYARYTRRAQAQPSDSLSVNAVGGTAGSALRRAGETPTSGETRPEARETSRDVSGAWGGCVKTLARSYMVPEAKKCLGGVMVTVTDGGALGCLQRTSFCASELIVS